MTGSENLAGLEAQEGLQKHGGRILNLVRVKP